MNLYFSALRVDHILGFFRLWELPAHAVTGLSGHFNPSHPVSAADLDARGLWDRQRLSTPYIRAHLLQRRFGKVKSESTIPKYSTLTTRQFILPWRRAPSPPPPLSRLGDGSAP